MNVLDLLSSLRKANIQITLVDDKLKIKAPKGAVTPEIKTQLANAKQEIIEFLQETAETAPGGAIIPVQDRSQPLQLSYTQEALWTLDRMNPGSVAYNLPMAFRFRGGLDVELLERAISSVIERHEILRLHVGESSEGAAIALIADTQSFSLSCHDLIVDENDNYDDVLKNAVDHYAMKPFNLAEGPLYRFDLLRVAAPSDQHDVLIICLHHIISDGLSQNLLVREIALLYAAYMQGTPSPLPVLPIQYLDFAAWQRAQLSGEKLQQEIEFWREQLRDVPPLLALPTDRPRPPIQTSRGTRFHFDIPPDTASAVIRYTHENGYTVFMGMMAALQMVLARHAKQNDFCLGMPTAGRHLQEVEQLVGFFVNGVLVRASLDDRSCWKEHVAAVKQRLLDVLSHQQTPAQVIIDHLDIPRNPAYPPLAQVGFQLQNFSGSVQSDSGEKQLLESFNKMTNLAMEPLRLEEADSKFDLIFSIAQQETTLSGYVEYNTDLFDEATINRLTQHYFRALASMVTQPDCRLANVELDSSAELKSTLGVDAQDQLSRLTTTQLAFIQNLQLRPDSRQYAVGFQYAIHEPVNHSVLEQAINHVINCHSVLRARFLRCDLPWADSAYQVFESHKEIAVEVVELGEKDDAESFVNHHFDNWCYRRHDVFNDELIHFQLMTSGEQSWLLLSCHHIILDGMSGMAMLRKIIASYEQLLNGFPAPSFDDQFSSYVQSHLDQVDQPVDVGFWKERARSVSPLTFSMPKAWPQDTDYHIQIHEVDAALLSDIQSYCRSQKTHPSIVYRLIAALLVTEYCRPEDDFVIWDIQSGRQTGQEDQIGVYYQQVPYVIPRGLLAGKKQASDFYKQQRQYRRTIRDNTFLSLSTLNQLFPAGSISVQFNYFNFLEPVELHGHASLPTMFASHVDETLVVLVKDYGDRLFFEVWYDGNVFVPLDFWQRMESLVGQLVVQPDLCFDQLKFLLPSEQTAIEHWNQTEQPLTYASIVPWLNQAALDFASLPALICGSISLSYAELERTSNQLAHVLAAKGVSKGSRVGLLLSRSQWSVISVLSVIKLGAVYVPIEASYPDERIRYILDDCAASVLICDACLRDKAHTFSGEICTIDDLMGRLEVQSVEAPRVTIDADDPIYIIYTSGSTGNPKGAQVTHRGEVNLQTWYTGLCEFNHQDRSLIISAFGFDLTQKNLFAPLLCGAAVVVPEMDEFDADRVRDEIERHNITHINCAPSALYALVNACDHGKAEKLQSLRWVFLGGEPIRITALQHWLQLPQTQARLVNSYGPTECADVVSYYVLNNTANEHQLIPIGKPICNTQLHLLDELLRPVPTGAIGEICISGAGVGLGYLNRPELTDEVFVISPKTGQMVYRTGDLGRFCPDGNIEYIGRRDFQVKVRGLRIELGEVEAAIKSLPAVSDAVVLVHNDSLVGYGLHPEGGSIPNWQSLLRQRLPEYMVPTCLITLEQWPLTPNGKIDRKALPDPDSDHLRSVYVAPRNDIEQVVADTWAQVLHLDQVGVEDSFFDLGGHSLLANQIVSRLRKHFDVDLPIRDLILHPTVAELAQRIQLARRSRSLPPLQEVSRAQRIPLSAAQQRMWLLDRLEPGNPAYHVPSVVRVEGCLDLNLLQKAFSAVINRHEGLRTFIAEDAQGPLQQFLPEADWSLQRIDAREGTAVSSRQRVTDVVIKPFDLACGPLFRAAVIQTQTDQFILAVVLHHMITDGWTNGLLVRELAQAYAQLMVDDEFILPQPSLHYADYAVWQTNYLAESRQEKMGFWRDVLSDVPALELPLDFPRPKQQTFRGSNIDFMLPLETVAAMQALANRYQATPFMVLLAAYSAMLQRYSGQESFAIGTPVSGRDRPELEEMAGFFVNTVAIPVRPEPTQSFSHCLEQVKRWTLDCFEHQDLPFEQIVENLNPVRDMSRSPVFQVMLAWQNLPAHEQGINLERFGDIALLPYDLSISTAKFEQTLTLWPTQDGVGGTLNYNTDLFSDVTARQLVDHFIRFCSAAFESPDRALYSINLLSPEEQALQLVNWNNTTQDYPFDRIEKLFTLGVEGYANQTAIVQGRDELTYGELDQTAQAIARKLVQQGVQPGQSVGVVLDRNLYLMSAILGVLKAGAVYIPIDAQYPTERILYICEQSGIEILVTQQHLAANLPEQMSLLDLADLSEWQHLSVSLPLVTASEEDLIYVIYTSGSTGNPKGTGAYHRSEANLLHWYQHQFGMNSSDRILLLSAIGFDLTQKNLFAPLLCGARLVIPDFQEFDPQRIVQIIAAQEITWLNCAPSAFYPLVDNPDDWPLLASLRYVFLGGEPINLSRLQAWLQQTQCQLINSYGPTECADIASWHRINPSADGKRLSVPIGRPNYNVQLYVLGEHQELLPRGAVGELCIGGDGVGPGYLNQPELTAAVFVPNPYKQGCRLYRTGDRVRYLANGSLEYLGRRDHQIKLRGYRVEAGEIQALINRDDRIKESLVDVRKNPSGVDQLVVWLATDSDERVQKSLIVDLKSEASQHLPRFMLPDAWLVLPKFPLTANGKIDRKALPLPDWAGRLVAHVAPRDALEVALCEIWSEVLHLDRVGIHDNFFELGGHSLLATQVASRVRLKFNVTLPIREIMSEPTIAELAPIVSRLQGQEPDHPIPRLDRQQRLPLSFAQQRLWLLDKIEPNSLAYTVPSILRIRGDLNPDRLHQALNIVLNRHEGLRTVFCEDESGPFQQIQADCEGWGFPIVDVSHHAGTFDPEAVEIETRRLLAVELMTPFDLEKGPLVRSGLFQLGPDHYVFMVLIHHIVTDGWSMNLLIQDLVTAYTQLNHYGAVYFDTPSIQYADFAAWQRERLTETRQQEMLTYWRGKLSGVEPLALPTDFLRPAVQTYNGHTLRFQLPGAVQQQLHRLSVANNTSLFACLLSGFFILLRQYSGQNNFCVGTPVAGRGREELEKVVGFFINTLAIRGEVTADDSFRDVLLRVKEDLLNAYTHQEMPFEQIVEAIDPARDMSRSPLFQVMLAYQNIPIEQQSLADAGNLSDLQVEAFDAGIDASKYEITLTLWDDRDGLGASLQYNTDLFSQETMAGLAGHYQALLAAVCEQADRPIGALDFLTTEERQQQLVEWNLTDRDYDKSITLDLALNTAFTRYPDAIAVQCGNETLSYFQLDQYSARFANLLRSKGVRTGDRIALCVDRYLHLLTIVLGAVRAGATYVPLDTSYPEERLQYIVDNADCKFIVTQSHLQNVLPPAPERLVIDQAWSSLDKYPDTIPDVDVSPEQLLYVIFTSGSTGKPKGTGAYHRSEMNLLHWYCEQFNMTAADRVLLLSAVGFDLTQKNLFAPLMRGACLVIPEFNEFDSQKIIRLIASQQISWLNCAPSAFYALQDEPSSWTDLRTLRLLFLGGEPINVPRIGDWLRHSSCQLVNTYGPTECADIATWYPVDVARDEDAPALPIGRPNYNVKLYILGDNLELLPVGAVGELCIAGDGVGPGYINNIEQTSFSFLNNPYALEHHNARVLYRTGDRVRYRTDGNIEYFGRRDHQIKLRGYRIEAGEIQSVINHLDGVRDSLVDVIKDQQGIQRLLAWVVAEPEQRDQIDEGAIKSSCHQRLPAFMVPEQWVFMSEFPLTPNGKVDRKALPLPESTITAEYVAPTNQAQERICKLWQETLAAQRVGITDNFFALGGQSLLATRLASKMSVLLGRTVSVRTLFENPSIEGLLQALAKEDLQVLRPPVVRRPDSAFAPLSYGQQRLWFFEQINPGTAANNMPVAVRIKGKLDADILQRAFTEVCRRHESLHSIFMADQDGMPIQKIVPPQRFQLTLVDLSQFKEVERQPKLDQLLLDNSRQVFDLSQAPLLRATLVKTAHNPDTHLLLLCMHHIISDGASQVVLFRELMTLYLAYMQSQPSPLPELPIHYGDYAYWQRNWLSDDALSQQLDYWQQQLEGAPALLDLPLDHARPAVQSTNGATLQRTFSSSSTDALVRMCEREQVTPFMATLCAWQLALYRFSGQSDICVGVPTLGRHSSELENVIGFFIQSLVLRNQFDQNPLLKDALLNTRKTVLEGFANSDVPVDRIVEHIGIARNPAYTPLVQVAFQLLDGAGTGMTQLSTQATLGDLEVEVEGGESATAKFDLTLNLVLDNGDLSASLEYNTDLFERSTVSLLLERFEQVCQILVENPEQPVASLELFSQEQLLSALDLDGESIESVQALSRMQHDMFMDNLVHPASLQSSHGWNIHIHRRLDVGLWQRALTEIVKQQPMLRARFVASQKASLDMGYLAIERVLLPEIKIIDLCSDDNQNIDEIVNALIYRPYDLQRDRLIHYYVVKLADDHYVVVTAVHHAILDGASLNVLWLQWTRAYEAMLEGREVTSQDNLFPHFVALDRARIDTEKEVAFWRNKLATVEPLACPLPPVQTNGEHFVTRELILEDEHWNEVKAFSRAHRITPSLYFKCLFGYLVQLYCRADHDFSIQETMAGRIKGHRDAMGCYIQEIPFVFEHAVMNAESRFLDLLEYARSYQKSIKEHRQISIGKQLELSPRGRVGFMYNFYQFLSTSEFLGQQFSPEGTPSDPAGNVQFVVTEVAGKLKLNLFYHQHLFADLAMLPRLASLSAQVIANSDIRFGQFDVVADPSERLQLLELWNDTDRQYDLSMCVHQKFEMQVASQPEAIAIVDDFGRYSYHELNSRANQLAHYLIEYGVKKGDLVGLCAERSRDFLVGILGIMKAGAAYVPMDPKYPDDRILYMIDNSQVRILLTQEILLEKTQSVSSAVHKICLDTDWGAIQACSDLNPNLAMTPASRAYMIYTSGSTGLPKGAIIRHDGAVNHIEAECEALNFDGSFNFLQTAPSSSDISVWQFVGPITRGGQVVVLDDVTHSSKLFRMIQQHRIDVVELVPVALQLLMEYIRQLPSSDRDLPALRWMMATGEAVTVDLVNSWLNLYPSIPVVNAYGPTEAADDVIQCSITSPLPSEQKQVPIGKPLGNLQVYILDQHLRLLPAGVPGEICIGGIGVGEGYWQNPEKTEQAFVVNPFAGAGSCRIYRTGDLGRWLPDGSIEYLDRVDNQVKVRGFRIELGEVEAALSSLPEVRECVVTVRDDMPGGKALAAYVVAASKDSDGANPQVMRAALRETLPDFMVPAAITVLAELPLTPAGKVDRKALPRPESIQTGSAEYVAPITDTECKLVAIWESLLPVDRVGITDNFFELGGHSLIGVRIIARINKEFSCNLQVASLLSSQSIRKLAAVIDSGTGNSDQSTSVIPLAESTNPALFMIHPVGGDVLCYADLARSLQDTYAVYGIRAPGLDGIAPIYSDIPDMIRYSVEAIRSIQPNGPYRLLGQSLGGIIALAVARKLEMEGEQVDHVVLLDSFSPDYLKQSNPSQTNVVASALGVNGDVLTSLSKDLSSDSNSYSLRLYHAGTQSGLLPAEMGPEQFAGLYRVALQNHHLCSQIEVEKVGAKVHHFTAENNPASVASGDSWRQSLPDLESVRVPGGHETLMQGNNSMGLSELIKQRLQSDNNNK